jgi:four helix bundle suffix protein
METLIPRHGGYENLRSFNVAEQIYDATVVFCDRFIDKRSRTHDQMVQAARSGSRNIAEGSLASATSKKTELKLTNVARASLGELLLDYKSFLRQKGLRLWDKNDPEALKVRSEKSNRSDWSDLPAEEFANIMVCLTNQASYLLWKQIQRLEDDFKKEGGFTERLYTFRKQARETLDNDQQNVRRTQ